MRRSVAAAVRKIGGLARDLDGGGTFMASIQPERCDGSGHTEIGRGFSRMFKMYAACNEVSIALREGSRVEYLGDAYAVKSIETYTLRGEPVFRRGTIILEREGG